MFWKKKIKEIDWQLLGISNHVKELLNSVDVFDILTERRISIKSFVENTVAPLISIPSHFLVGPEGSFGPGSNLNS